MYEGEYLNGKRNGKGKTFDHEGDIDIKRELLKRVKIKKKK